MRSISWFRWFFSGPDYDYLLTVDDFVVSGDGFASLDISQDFRDALIFHQIGLLVSDNSVGYRLGIGNSENYGVNTGVEHRDKSDGEAGDDEGFAEERNLLELRGVEVNPCSELAVYELLDSGLLPQGAMGDVLGKVLIAPTAVMLFHWS